MLSRMPRQWETSLAIIRTPAMPSERQLASALAGSRFTAAESSVVDLDGLADLIAEERPDVVLLSVRGPVVRVLVRMIVGAVGKRPVIVSGLPGISIPATMNALYYRSQVDLVLLHSKREVREFSALAESLGIQQDFGLATLPFLAMRPEKRDAGTDIVFAAQAKVPRDVADRHRVIEWLAATARQHPDRRVVIKLRGARGEAQTHAEKFPYDSLLEDLSDRPGNLVTSTGPMSAHLAKASALATVSSTAAIEAIAVGVPVLILDSFGIEPRLINLVFQDSGLFGDSDALIAGTFREPNEKWLDDNYFHSPSDETWIERIQRAAAIREHIVVPLRPQFRAGIGGNLRRIWDRKRALGGYDRSVEGYIALAVGVPLRGGVRLWRRVRSRLSPQSAVRAPAKNYTRA